MPLELLLLTIPLFFLTKKKSPSTKPLNIIKIPQGKGLFLEKLDDIDPQKLKELKIEWIAILYYEKEQSQLDLYSKAKLLNLSKTGIKVWLWAIPSAYDLDNFIKLTKTYQSENWVEGFIYYLEEEFIKVQNSSQVLFSKTAKEIKKSVGLLSDPEINLENLDPVFKFDAYQVHSGFNGEDNTNIQKKFPVFMDKSGKLNQSLATYAFWWDPQNLDWIKNS